MKTFFYQHDFKNLVNNSSKPAPFNLFLTIDRTYFQKTKAFSVSTGLSDYYKLVSCHNTKNQLSEIQTSSNKL